ncbi:hypothetical protein [Candidatus Hodgkinia cicadicola]|uniref:hypothetical protein n=1 Tax=Candidatus Hodgkinia cicadicola TaxID=573658 RepID=UPI0011BA7B49
MIPHLFYKQQNIHVKDLNVYTLKKLFWSNIKVIVKQTDNPTYHPLVIANRLINETNNIIIMVNIKQISKTLVGTNIVELKVRYSERINRTDVVQTVITYKKDVIANILY